MTKKTTTDTDKKKKTSTEEFIKGKIGQTVNKKDKKPANEFVVVTKDDNLVHNYFHYCETYWDSHDSLSKIILRFPKASNKETKYWIGYQGEVWCYMGNELLLRNIKNIQQYNITTKHSPFFVGKIDIIKEHYEQIEIRLNNIGGRFKQSIPDQFRQSYINNQNVRDAFQAICEFLGVYYICPPKTESTSGMSGVTDINPEENDPQTTQKTEQNVAQKIVNQAKKTVENQVKNETGSTDGINTTDTQDQQQNQQQDQQQIQQGYGQINFDANGAITYNNAVIEESPDMSETLINMEDDAFDIYLEDETEIMTDVTDFLNGKVFEETHGDYLDYNAITIEPKSSASSQMSEVNTGENTETGQIGENGGTNTDSSTDTTGTGNPTT